MTESRTLPSGKPATPQRWQQAALRALEEGVEVRQVNENGMWVANSGTQPGVAYALEIAEVLVLSCSCPAMTLWGDPVCKHQAAYYLQTGRIVLPSNESEVECSAT